MSMMDIGVPVLNRYNGSLYPYGDADSDSSEQTATVKPLVDLCSGKIVQDSTSTQRALAIVPKELCYSLMKAALCHDRDRSVEVLLACWPWPTLCLKKFAPRLFDSIDVLHSHTYTSERMRRGVRYTTCLAHTFVECLKKRTPSRLKCLDLTGYPTAEVIVNYLSSHALLMHNEARQREIITVYDEMTQNWPQEYQGRYTLDPTLPEEKYTVRLDASLHNNDAHMELCRALRASKNQRQCLQLEVNKLELSCLGAARVSVLLGELDNQGVSALSLQYNALSSEGIMVLGPELQKFPNLTSLDLSRNGFDLRQAEVCAMMTDTLASLPQLVCLDLCSNWLKNKLSILLSRVQRPLEYLKIGGCGLKSEDLVYLQGSHHASSLQVLDLSDHIYSECFDSLLGVLRATASTLRALDLEDASLHEEQWMTLFSHCHLLAKLRFLNVARNINICREVMVESVAQLVKMADLQAVRCTFPCECWIDVDPEVIAGEQERFRNLYCRLVEATCIQAERPPIKFILVE